MSAPFGKRAFHVRPAYLWGWGVLCAVLAYSGWAPYLAAGPALVLGIESGLFWMLLLWSAIRATRRYPLGRGDWAPAIGAHAAVGSALALLDLLRTALRAAALRDAVPADIPIGLGSGAGFGALRVLLAYALIAGVAHAVEYARWYRSKELRAARLEAELARTELEEARTALRALRLELNPHFLLNGLNGTAALVEEDPLGARRMLVGLGDLLRRLLTQREQEVSLEEEIELLRGFVGLERERLGGRLEVVWGVPESALDARVPEMILQPLLENAIRHGILPRRGGTVVVEAERKGERLELRVRDDGVGLAEVPARRGTGGTGIGLRNVRERLRRLYGSAAELVLEPVATGGTCARLSLPWHEEAAEDDVAPPARPERRVGAGAMPLARPERRVGEGPTPPARSGSPNARLPRPDRWIGALGLAAWFLVLALLALEALALEVGGVGPDGEPLPLAVRGLVALYTAAVFTGFAYVVFRMTRRFPLSWGRWRHVAAHALAAPALGSAAAFAILAIVPFVEYQRGPESLFETGLRRTRGLTILYGLLMAAAHAVEYARWYRSKEVRAARLEADLARTELEEARTALRALRLELNPHFLLNGLNGAAALVEEDPLGARRMLVGLGDLLRRSLTQREQEVELEEEIELLRGFVGLERERLGGRLEVVWDVPESALDARVPEMILQPLLENAIRHGILPRRTGTVVVEAEQKGDRLELRVRDDGVGLAEVQARRGTGGTGIGLRNVRERLRRLYGSAAELVLEPVAGGGTCARLSLPWHEEAADDVARSRVALSGAGS